MGGEETDSSPRYPNGLQIRLDSHLQHRALEFDMSRRALHFHVRLGIRRSVRILFLLPSHSSCCLLNCFVVSVRVCRVVCKGDLGGSSNTVRAC